MTSSSAPLVWRLRHRLGAIAFWIAAAIVALGAWTTMRSIAEGDGPGIGFGLTLMVSGALIMVGRKMRERDRRRRRA